MGVSPRFCLFEELKDDSIGIFNECNDLCLI